MFVYFTCYQPSTSAENPVGKSLPADPSSNTDMRTSFLAKMTCGRLPPYNRKPFHFYIKIKIKQVMWTILS